MVIRAQGTKNTSGEPWAEGSMPAAPGHLSGNQCSALGPRVSTDVHQLSPFSQRRPEGETLSNPSLQMGTPRHRGGVITPGDRAGERQSSIQTEALAPRAHVLNHVVRTVSQEALDIALIFTFYLHVFPTRA